MVLFLLLLTIAAVVIVLQGRKRLRSRKSIPHIDLPGAGAPNQIQLFSEFMVISSNREDITENFTPKIRELFLFVLIHTIHNGNGAKIDDINEQLWPGIDSKKLANNRAVTLNKLRKLLKQMEGIAALALRFTILTAARTSETRYATWGEIDLAMS